MTKKKNKKQVFVLRPWCWYCEKEVEDEKVLLQHQKAKHFKCGQCPRKLNTAGGLMVHCQQVHKVEPDKLTNTLPGRDGYDVEIFGMEGIPARDADEWRTKKQREAGFGDPNGRGGINGQAGPKRPKIDHGVIGEEECRRLLEGHKRLMGVGRAPGPVQGGFPPFGFPQNGMPPMGQQPFLPPPNFLPPGSNPQMPFRPPFPMPLPNGMMPPQPPNGFLPPPNGMMMPPFMPPSGFRPPMPMPGMGFPPGFPAVGAAPVTPVKIPTEEEMRVQEPKDGTLWPDNEFSPAEKRALQARYRYASPVLASSTPLPPPGFMPPANFMPMPNPNFLPPPQSLGSSPYGLPTPFLAGVSPSPSTPLVGSNVAPEPPANAVIPVISEEAAAAIPSSPIPAPGTTYATAVKDEEGDAIDPEPVPQAQEDIDGTFAHEVKAELAEDGVDVGEVKSEGLAIGPSTSSSRKRKAAEDFMD